MDEYGQMQPHKHKRKGGIGGKLIMIGVLIIIILIAVFAYYFMGGPINVSGPTTVTVNANGAEFAIAGKSYVATLIGYNNNTQTAYIYVSSVPIFMDSVLNVTLHKNVTVKINYDSQYSIMQIRLLSGKAGSVSVQIAPLAASLQVDPDTQYIGHPNASLPGLKVTVSTTTVSPNTTTTTIASGSNTPAGSTTTIKAATTTIAASTNYTVKAIDAAVKGDQNYGLLLNFTTLYDQTANCTPHQYNLSYFEQTGTLHPVPPVDFLNVSYETPSGMVQKIISKGGNSYSYEFLPIVQDPAFNGTVALQIGLVVAGAGTSSATATVTSDSYSGIFKDATYSILSGTYTQSKEVTNACAAMIG